MNCGTFFISGSNIAEFVLRVLLIVESLKVTYRHIVVTVYIMWSLVKSCLIGSHTISVSFQWSSNFQQNYKLNIHLLFGVWKMFFFKVWTRRLDIEDHITQILRLKLFSIDWINIKKMQGTQMVTTVYNKTIMNFKVFIYYWLHAGAMFLECVLRMR